MRRAHRTDYILCSPELEPKLIEALKRALAEFSAPSASSGTRSTSLLESKNYSKIINENHFKRLSKLLDATEGDVIVGGKRDEKERKIEVTLVRNVKPNDALMQGQSSLSLSISMCFCPLLDCFTDLPDVSRAGFSLPSLFR